VIKQLRSSVKISIAKYSKAQRFQKHSIHQNQEYSKNMSVNVAAIIRLLYSPIERTVNGTGCLKISPISLIETIIFQSVIANRRIKIYIHSNVNGQQKLCSRSIKIFEFSNKSPMEQNNLDSLLI
jgi:hypothetical protein